ncbi:MAG TPA: hypothetical protein VKU85_21220, partial [bacterium]|nr:hypothetical protein [bacterium]
MTRNRRLPATLTALTFAVVTTAMAQAATPTAELVADIRPGLTGSDPWWFVAAEDFIYFVADDGTHGTEPFLSDGTALGTKFPRQTQTGSGGGAAYMAHLDGNVVLFMGSNTTDGAELWTSDGTWAGTYMVKDLWVGGSSGPRLLASASGKVYFQAITPSYGYELYVSDGTAGGTELVKDIYPGVANAWSEPGLPMGDLFFFSAVRNSPSNREPWVTDGTTAGTQSLGELTTGTPGSFPVFLGVVNGEMLFSAQGDGVGYELWASDGTAAGTRVVKDVVSGNPSSGPVYEWVLHEGLLYYGISDAAGWELWVSDGTATGTERVADINPTGDSQPRDLESFQGHVWFGANDGNGDGLWKSDGTAQGTVEVWSGYVQMLHATSTLLYFLDLNGMMWATDGTTGGTVPVAGAPMNASDMVVFQDQLFFDGTYESGRELWRAFDNDATDAPAVASALSLSLQPARPNPAATGTVLSYSIPVAAASMLEVFDVRGARVRVLEPERVRAAGTHTVTWDGRDSAGAPVGSGV